MKTDRQSLEALEERLNDPELYVDAIDDAVDVIIQLERERDEAVIKYATQANEYERQRNQAIAQCEAIRRERDSALQSSKDNAANFRSSEVKRIEAEREMDEARQCFEIAKGNTEAALNSFHAEQKQRRQAEQELEVLRKRVSEYQPYADNALTAASKVIEWQQCEQERDQLRKVADELAYCSGCGCGVDFGLCNRCSTASNSYNQLPHVIERNAK